MFCYVCTFKFLWECLLNNVRENLRIIHNQSPTVLDEVDFTKKSNIFFAGQKEVDFTKFFEILLLSHFLWKSWFHENCNYFLWWAKRSQFHKFFSDFAAFHYCLFSKINFTKNAPYDSVWKFHDFSMTHILPEVNVGDSRSAKCAILTHLEAFNFYFT